MTCPDDPADDPADHRGDPTHALDDFLRRMRPAPGSTQATGDPTDLSGLTARLHPERAAQGHAQGTPSSPEARPRGGTLRNGQTWDADDVTDVPVVELPRVAPTAAPPDAGLLDGIARAASQAAALAAEASAGAAPELQQRVPLPGQPGPGQDWQPDAQALQLRRATDPRLLSRWQPGAWIGAQRVVLAAATELLSTGGGAAADAPVVESYEAQRLLLLWAPPMPAAPRAGRWPQQVLLGAVPADQAGGALLAVLPPDTLLWLDPEPGHVDWALAAELALHHVPALRPFQIDGLRAFIEAEREATFARINDGYEAAPGGARARGSETRA